MWTVSEQTHIQIENTNKAITKLFKKAEKGKHENLLKIQQRKTYKYKAEEMKKIQRPMVIEGEKKIIMNFPFYGTTFKNSDKSLCKGWQTKKKCPHNEKEISDSEIFACT